ncbi:agmatinase [Tamaricihabitans halophyticus]|uniref:Agmatinase n=1 Tax=Tamaricihabitans halophyticus TaxID=1262583 RepID=A0A4R2Q1V2_9PSEU|nr:arginase family protein [Tamaricihabitans halophyticus]TCP42623.1 agmatinase [Tamaricihabitans halophyticus]
MTTFTTQLPATGLLGAETHADLSSARADFVVLGIPYGVPYHMRGVHSGAADAPHAFRERTRRFNGQSTHYDFDLGGTLFGDTGAVMLDCGDLPGDPRDLDGNAVRATEAVETLLAAGATPIILGGDDSVPPLAVRAFERHGPVNVLQIDAHLDFRDEVGGIRDGYSSPMRRIAELPWVNRIVQVGLRGVGSARPEDVHDAHAAGNILITADAVHRDGPDVVLRSLTTDAPWFVTIDVDGLDPTIAPGTSVPLPGGLSYTEAAAILRGLAQHCDFGGLDIVEHFPSLDIRDLTSITLGRLVATVLGTAARRRAA